MNPREQTTAITIIGATLVAVAVAGGYFFIFQPLVKYREAEAALAAEVDDLERQLREQNATVARLKPARARSLPADATLASREYVVALEQMIEASGVPKGYTITEKKVGQTARDVPEISKGKPIYTRLAFEVNFKKTDLAALKNFLQRFYQFGPLHQITALTVKKDDDPGNKGGGHRDDLSVAFTTEAIIVEGAENRKTLLPVPSAFSAVGGGALYLGLANNTEAARGVVLPMPAPALSTLRRDYDLIVRKDPFHGPLPPESPPEKFKMASLRDVKVRTDEKHDPVKVSLSGEGSVGATVTAVASGSLFAEGALKVDPKTNAIDLPRTSATEGTATVSVIATSADRTETVKATFKVSLEEPPPPPEGSSKPREDISFAIILTGTTPRSDGTAWARVFDNANLLRYTIEAKQTGVSVSKEYKIAPTLPWRPDKDHAHPEGVLVISDEETGTRRTFKVIAVDIDGLIVADLKPDEVGTDKKGPPAKGGRPGFGGGFGKGPPKQGPANPLAALGGNMIAAVPQPKFYRWPVGQPLNSLKPLTDDEAKKVQKAVEASGPVFDVATAAP
jgi:hypothetical protein